MSPISQGLWSSSCIVFHSLDINSMIPWISSNSLETGDTLNVQAIILSVPKGLDGSTWGLTIIPSCKHFLHLFPADCCVFQQLSWLHLFNIISSWTGCMMPTKQGSHIWCGVITYCHCTTDNIMMCQQNLALLSHWMKEGRRNILAYCQGSWVDTQALFCYAILAVLLSAGTTEQDGEHWSYCCFSTI